MTKIIIAWELLGQKVPKSHIAEHLGVSRRTVIRWAKGIAEHGSLEGFLEHYQQAKKGSRKKRKTDAILKRRIWGLRQKYHDCCGQKIQYFLEQEYATQVSVTTIYKVLAEKYQLRSKWQKNQKRGPVPRAEAPREVIQMDTVAFGAVFAFTAIDIFSKESAVLLRPALEASDGQAFCTIVCPGVLMVLLKSFKRMAAVNSKKSFRKMSPNTASSIASPAHTRKMSRALLRASTAACARSAWVGISIQLLQSPI